MNRPIMRDVLFLGQKSEEATRADEQVIVDLKDTLHAHRDGCVGMAANMIGFKKRIIIVSMGVGDLIMVNPVLKNHAKSYQTEEGCLSLVGVRPVTRYEQIEVEYLDEDWVSHRQAYTGYVAQIIQHEMDHLEGIII